MVMFEMATTRHSSKPPRWNHFLDAITRKVTVCRSTWHHKIEDISYVIWATWSLILPHFKTRFAHSFPLGAMCSLEDEFRAISQPSFGYTFLSLKCFFFQSRFSIQDLPTVRPSIQSTLMKDELKLKWCWEKITKPLTWPDDRFNNQSILFLCRDTRSVLLFLELCNNWYALQTKAIQFCKTVIDKLWGHIFLMLIVDGGLIIRYLVTLVF